MQSRLIRLLVAALAACAVVAPAAVAVQDLRSPDARDAAARIVGGTPSSVPRDLRSPDVRDAARGLTPVAAASKVGDTKFDSPGASRAPQYDTPRTIQVVRPERTIVRDTDPVLPIALSGAALLVALGLAGTALIRVRSLRLG
jgi:hypothetical protein